MVYYVNITGNLGLALCLTLTKTMDQVTKVLPFVIEAHS